MKSIAKPLPTLAMTRARYYLRLSFYPHSGLLYVSAGYHAERKGQRDVSQNLPPDGAFLRRRIDCEDQRDLCWGSVHGDQSFLQVGTFPPLLWRRWSSHSAAIVTMTGG